MRTAQLLMVLMLCCGANGQGTFRNLDFGLSQVQPSTQANSLVPASQAFPFWTTYVDATPISLVRYDGVNIGTPGIAFLDSQSPVGPIVPGFHTAVLQAGGTTSVLLSAAIAQTAVVPQNAMVLVFVASAPIGEGWSVTIGGQQIPVVESSQVR